MPGGAGALIAALSSDTATIMTTLERSASGTMTPVPVSGPRSTSTSNSSASMSSVTSSAPPPRLPAVTLTLVAAADSTWTVVICGTSNSIGSTTVVGGVAPAGVAVPLASAPLPLAFSARTAKVCSTAFGRLLTVTAVSSATSLPASVPSAMAVQSGDQVVPPSPLTRYCSPVTALPPSSDGSSHDTATAPSAGMNERLRTAAGVPSSSTIVAVDAQAAPPVVDGQAVPSARTTCTRVGRAGPVVRYTSNVSSDSSVVSSAITTATPLRASHTLPTAAKSAARISTSPDNDV